MRLKTRQFWLHEFQKLHSQESYVYQGFQVCPKKFEMVEEQARQFVKR